MCERLAAALRALNYDPGEKATTCITLLFGIRAHALLRNDGEIVAECDALIAEVQERRRAEAQGPAASP